MSRRVHNRCVPIARGRADGGQGRLGLVGEAAHVALDVGLICFGKVRRLGVTLEQGGSGLVHADIRRLGREDHGYEQLVWVVEVKRRVRIAVGLRQPLCVYGCEPLALCA